MELGRYLFRYLISFDVVVSLGCAQLNVHVRPNYHVSIAIGAAAPLINVHVPHEL